jgi:hypothetical protein
MNGRGSQRMGCDETHRQKKAAYTGERERKVGELQQHRLRLLMGVNAANKVLAVRACVYIRHIPIMSGSSRKNAQTFGGYAIKPG